MDLGLILSGWFVAAILAMILMAKKADRDDERQTERLERRAALEFGAGLKNSRAQLAFLTLWLCLEPAMLEREFPDWPKFRDTYIAQNTWGAE